jgi:NitT/TauT family transport system ATP-binding protein
MNLVLPPPLKSSARSQQPSGLRIDHLYKAFGSRVIFDQFSIEFPHRQVTALLGCNGCGKSTLLHILSGLISADRGQVSFAGKSVKQARIGYVFQHYQASLFPWLTAQENLLYPLKLAKFSHGEQRDRLSHLIATYEVKFDLQHYPYQLSGGQQQLLAILRAVIAKPDILFLDEPFSALDFETRFQMRQQVQRICLDLGVTTVIVSHDLDDAIYLADRLLILGRSPTQVITEIPVPFDRPRQPILLADPVFAQIKQTCLHRFQTRGN